jgi:tetratricopeptide (TPR) repeat protein
MKPQRGVFARSPAVPEFIVLSCPVCAGPLESNGSRCGYCGSMVFIRTDHPRIDPSSLNKALIDEHIARYRRAVRQDDYDETAHYGLGVAYFNLGLLDEAAEELTVAARLMPENPNIQAQLAVIFSDLAVRGKPGASQLAWDRLNRTLLLRPDHVEALYLKVEMHRRLGAWEKALETLERIVDERAEDLESKRVLIFLAKASAHVANREWQPALHSWEQVHRIRTNAIRQPIAQFLNTHIAIFASAPQWSEDEIVKRVALLRGKGLRGKMGTREARDQAVAEIEAEKRAFLNGSIPDPQRLLGAANFVITALIHQDRTPQPPNWQKPR